MRTLTTSLAITTLTLAASAGSAPALRSCPPPKGHTQHHPGCCVQRSLDMEIVFVLDTTGSMGGLIEGAKQKIWSIASTIAQSNQGANIRMGLVAYRDRGDDYVTMRTALTDDLDNIYSDLMRYEARGGGDAPESVNEALFKAVERTEWSDRAGVLRVVYLVGDAPPHMDYEDDVKYHATCKLARERGVFINTIQCGSMHGTEHPWRDIARSANGSYARIAHDSGVQAIATPYDEQIAALEREHASLMIDYGDHDTMRVQIQKRASARSISAKGSGEALADRAAYAQTEAGARTRYGAQELVNDVTRGNVALDEIDPDHLPESLQSKTLDELRTLIERNAQRRDEINAQIKALLAKRASFMEDARPEDDSFDAQILITLEEQAKSLGITLELVSEQTNED